jgi:hypothetical protein
LRYESGSESGSRKAKLPTKKNKVKIFEFIFNCKVCKFFVIKNLDLDPNSPKSLDPVPDLMNPDLRP